MKQLFQISLYIAACFFCTPGIAQNVYDGSILPTVSGSGPGAENPPANYSGISLFNYTRRYVPLQPMTSIPGFDATKNLPVHVTTSYRDGFGLPLLIINRNGSSRDIMQPFDLRARDVKVDYLPYPDTSHRRFKMKPFENQASYYFNKFPAERLTAYSKTKLEKEDGITYTKRYAPGLQNVGQERGTSSSAHTNSSSELPVIYYNGTTICTTGTYWPQHSLLIAREENMHGQEGFTYSDKGKRIVCKKVKDNNTSVGNVDGYLYTYYLYDDLGKLTHIVPPLAYLQLINNGCLSNIQDLCFSYKVDEFGNVIEKHTPARDAPDEIIYDVNYKAVMSRSANMADRNQWGFSIYDKQGRVVMTGIYTGHLSTAYWRNVVLGKVSPISRGVGITPNQTLEYWLKNNFTGNTYPLGLDSCVMHTYNYYDNYANAPLGSPTSFDNSNSASYLTGAGMVTPQPYYFVNGKLIASKTRILTNGIANNFSNTPWLTSVYFYDEKSKIIQTHTLNPWNNITWDVTTVQYNFAGNAVLDINKVHLWADSDKPVTQIMNKYTFGNLTGRLETVQQKIDTGYWQPLAGYHYDEMGTAIVKWLGNVEEQVYSFDIRGKNTGVNADSLMHTSVISNTKTFYSKLYYDHGYDHPRYDGAISGFMWRIRGHDPMSYGYSYDDVNRLTAAEFRAYNNNGSLTWNKDNIDFTVSDIAYDVNGNMLQMNQRGYDPNMSPTDIDVLAYTYDDGNRLIKVEDNGQASAAFIRDFDNGTTHSSNDYQYDLNGNLVADENKRITGIVYNHLDLPDSIVGDSGTVKNIYTASGGLLQKIITEGGVSDTLRYWGPFVIRNNHIDHVLHSEGRARYDTSADKFTYDFFVKDHLGNVRTIVEGSSSYDEIEYHAGWEIISANYEERFFDQVGETRDAKPQTFPNGEHSGRLNGNDPGRTIGASILVHVMAGDELNLEAYGYYEHVEPNGYDMYTMPENMYNSLFDVMTGGIAPGGESGEYLEAVNNLVSANNYAIYDAMKQSITSNAFPRVYLNYLVFDETFTLRPEHSQVVQIQGGANVWHKMQLPTRVVMPVTGYVLAYLSNESPFDAWVDNENLIHYESNLVEENHYYPHGLVIEGGSQSVEPKNDYLHQGKKLQRELGLELYDFHARQYDPQIGRFWGIDPADQFPSGYTGMGNDPANMIDPSGMWSEDHGIATNPKYAKMGGSPFTVNQFIRMRDDMERWHQTQMALGTDKIPDQTLSGEDYQGGAMSGAGPSTTEILEAENAAMILAAAADAESMLNSDAALNTVMTTDDIGFHDGVFEIPGIGTLIGELSNLGKDLFEKMKNGEMSLAEVKYAIKNVEMTPFGLKSGESNTSTSIEFLNLGKVRNVSLLFDGKSLSIIDNGTNVYSTPAVSGKAVNGKFDYSIESQGMKDKGPIPEGKYSIDATKIQSFKNESGAQQILSTLGLGLGRWPGGMNSWGEQRAWISPIAGTNTFGRGGFSIHSGGVPGSIGCIDLAPYGSMFFSYLQTNYGNRNNIPLTVKY